MNDDRPWPLRILVDAVGWIVALAYAALARGRWHPFDDEYPGGER